MAVIHTLAAIGRFIRRTPPPPADLLEAYAHEVIPVLDRAEWLYAYWLEQSTLFTDSEKLGNVAAIHRWETATMGRSLERVIPPSVLADAHERVIDALDLASRAAQLLSNGSRFHNANAVCEGQALLTVSRERRLAALKSMRRYLARVQAEQPAADALAAEYLAAAPPTFEGPASPSPESLSTEESPLPAALAHLAPVEGTAAAPIATSDGDPLLSDTVIPPTPDPAPAPSPKPADEPVAPPESDPQPAVAPTAHDPSTVAPAARTASAPPAPTLPPEAATPQTALPDATPAETAAPEPTVQPNGPPAEPSSPAGWGSLFGRRLDQPDR
jgi:hypothetical protein